MLKIIYAGRYEAQLIEKEGFGDKAVLLSDHDVLPVFFFEKLKEADLLVVLDLPSFPFDQLNENHWNIPMVFFMPEWEYGIDDTIKVFDDILFKKISFFDKIICNCDELWLVLHGKYGFGEGQRIVNNGGSAQEQLMGFMHTAKIIDSMNYNFTQKNYVAHQYWEERANFFDDMIDDKLICSLHHTTSVNKHMHRLQAKVLKEAISPFLTRKGLKQKLRILEVGCGIGRWVSLFEKQRFDYFGIDISSSMIDAATKNYPEHFFQCINTSMSIPYEDEFFDCVFAVTVLHHNDLGTKKQLLSEMYRVLRSGGMLIVLEDFVASRNNDKQTVYPLGIKDFFDLLIDTTNGQLVVNTMETIKYDHVDETRSSLISFVKLRLSKKC